MTKLWGPEHGRWKGTSVSTKSKHDRVRRRQGKATSHPCVSCNGPAQEWARIHTEDGNDPWTDYVPMCIQCHKRYDKREMLSRRFPGQYGFTDGEVRTIRWCLDSGLTVSEIANELGVRRRIIRNIESGDAYSWVT